MPKKTVGFLLRAVMAMTLLWGGDDASARALKYMRAGNATPMSITLDTVKRTSPALALSVPGDGDTWYANLTAVTDITVGGLYINHNAITYAVMDNVDDINDMDPKFWLTTTPGTSEYMIYISAAGTFSIDWGDGQTQTITHDHPPASEDDAMNFMLMHEYATADAYTIGIGGRATGYKIASGNVSELDATILLGGPIAGLDGSLGAIFPTIGNGQAKGSQPMFMGTFAMACSPSLSEIPSGLFAGINGQPVPHMFYWTFHGCSGLTTIGDKMFGNLSGTAQDGMFKETFSGCTSLTGPSARTTSGKYLYEIWPDATEGQVGNCYDAGATGLADYAAIPAPWRAQLDEPEFWVTTTPNTSSFSFKMSAKGSFTVDWGDGTREKIKRTNTSYDTYSHTYTTAGTYTISLGGDATEYAVTSAVLFTESKKIAGLSGNLGAIFPTLTNAGSGAKQPNFAGTFSGCTNLTEIPSGLFAGISGAPVKNMFYQTFKGCTNLTTIGDGLFGDLSGTAQDGMFVETFDGCTSLTGPSAQTTSGKYLYEIWPDATAAQVGDCYDVAIGLMDYADIPVPWKVKDPEFWVTTTPDTSSFTFEMTPKGTFVIDWGDGTREKIRRTTTYYQTKYSHTYANAGTYTIGIGGQATEYSDVEYEAAIKFSLNAKSIAGIKGSLGAIFSTIGDGSAPGNQPKFASTFRNCSNMTGSIPAELFTGISGAPVDDMFSQTFAGCSGLTGEIPAGLFAGISGAPASSMFSSTFSSCTGLTGEIPAGLFAGISGAPASYMFADTFYGCTGLTGEIPSGLFAGISGAPAQNMFDGTFWKCSGLTSIGDGLFGDLSGTGQTSMFRYTFAGCTSLAGPSAKTTSGKYLYQIWYSGNGVFSGYSGASGLSDYASIPAAWK